jgi:hypothetical protein
MSFVEGRADIKDLLLEVYFNRTFGAGVVDSLARRGCGPVGLFYPQNFRVFQKENPLEVATTRNLLSDVRFGPIADFAAPRLLRYAVADLEFDKPRV